MRSELCRKLRTNSRPVPREGKLIDTLSPPTMSLPNAFHYAYVSAYLLKESTGVKTTDNTADWCEETALVITYSTGELLKRQRKSFSDSAYSVYLGYGTAMMCDNLTSKVAPIATADYVDISLVNDW